MKILAIDWLVVAQVHLGSSSGGFVAKTVVKINKSIVDLATPKDARYYVWDAEIKGFGVTIWPSGIKSYIFDYRTPEGDKKRFTIGKHGNVTAEQARVKAKELAAGVVTGTNPDPSGNKQVRRQALSVAELLEAYASSGSFAEKTRATQVSDRGRITNHLIPTLGRIVADQLKPEQVRRAFAEIRDGKTAKDSKTGFRGRSIVRGGEGTARMAIRLLRSALNWAAEEGYLTDNAAKNVSLGSDGVRNVILEDQDQYRRLFETLAKMERERRVRSEVADAIRVIALTGARKGEIAELKWSQVDLKRGLLILSAKHHKTGKRTGKGKEIGLPASAQAIIARQKPGESGEYVFPPASGVGPLSLAKPWLAIRAEAELPEGLGIHGLRHSLASMMAVNGAQAAELMTALGHRQLSTTQRYIHWAQDAKAAMIDRYTAGIAAALEDRDATGEVLPIHSKLIDKRK